MAADCGPGRNRHGGAGHLDHQASQSPGLQHVDKPLEDRRRGDVVFWASGEVQDRAAHEAKVTHCVGNTA